MKKTFWLGLGVAGALSISTVADAALDGKASDFLKTAIKGDNSEIMLGKQVAQNPTASERVKTFAQMLIDDHSQHLHMLKGASFDNEFAKYMVADHQKDIAEFKKEAARRDGDVSKLAEESLPTLRKHLNAALKLERR